jgi:hypothetical protein
LPPVRATFSTANPRRLVPPGSKRNRPSMAGRPTRWTSISSEKGRALCPDERRDLRHRPRINTYNALLVLE